MNPPDRFRRRRTRILVVDSEVIMRRALSEVLREDAALEVIGTAAQSSIALAKLEQLGPDLVILHAHLPDCSIALLSALKRLRPSIKILVLHAESLQWERSLAEAFLCQGVTEYAVRPVCSSPGLYAELRERLLPQVQGLSAGFSARDPSIAPPPRESRSANPAPISRTALVRPESSGELRAVLIASSTGGPRALDTILPALPCLEVPVLIVQHMPPVFTKALAERLSARCAFPVFEATSGQVVEPGKAWLAAGGYHLSVVRRGSQVETQIHQGAPENSVRPAADVLFRSAAAIWGGKLLVVVLTGMGQDGLRGTEEIVRAGGRAIVQDEATSVVWGMPGFVAQRGLADAVLPIQDISREITRRVQRRARLGFAERS